MKFNIFNKKKCPTISDYNRIKVKAERCFNDIFIMQNISESEDKFYLLTFSNNKKVFSKLCRGDLFNRVIWLTNLWPDLVLINSWELNKEQYEKLYIKDYIEDQLMVEGFEVTHFPK